MTARVLVALLTVGYLTGTASAQISSNSKVIAPFKAVVASANESTVRIRSGPKDIALGTVVFADGFILTKASELRGQISVRLSDGTEYDATVVGRHKESDLALLHVDVKDLKPVLFSDSAKVPLGNWLIAASATSDPVGVGIVSAKTRELTGQDKEIYNHNKGFLGIEMEDADYKDKEGNVVGAVVKGVTKDGAAKKAGLKEKDVIIAIEGTKVPGRVALKESLENSRPGEPLTVTILREGEEKKLKVTLTGELSQKGRGDLQNAMGGELSGRRTGFPSVLQTDMVIDPKNCGGPIIDLNGKVLGISIARAGRVETWILPSENIRPILADLKAGKFASTVNTSKSEK
jgi:serine protease Do